MSDIRVLGGASDAQVLRQERLVDMLRSSPLPANELLHNLGLYLTRQTLSRVLFMHELYQLIIPVTGIVVEFGVRWGQNLALLSALRGMYEPYNYNRKIVGFDTWQGFPAVDAKDGKRVAAGDYGVTRDYMSVLQELLELHEQESPIAHKRKFELVKGDATRSFEEYLAKNPQTIVAFAYFDFDIYAPTRRCLELLMERVTRGTLIAFDELNCPEFPGETLALMEVVGLRRFALRRTPNNPLISYLVVDA